MIKWTVRVVTIAASGILGAVVSWDVLYRLATPVGDSIGGSEVRDPGPLALLASGLVFLAVLAAGVFGGVVLSNRVRRSDNRARQQGAG